jgi:hypothetical protein
MCRPSALVRCWVDDSTEAGRGVSQGLAVWAETSRGFEDFEQGDGAKVNQKRAGILVSRRRLQEMVEQPAAEKALCPHGLVVGVGPAEPAGWGQHWRSQLGAPAAVKFRWRSSGSDVGPFAAAAAAAATEAAQEAARVAADAGASEAAQAEVAEAAVGSAAAAEAAAAAAVDPRALAAAPTVWLAFDGLPPPDEVQEILSSNRGVWLPTVDAEANRLQKACQRVQADGAADRWVRGPQLVLPVVADLKEFGAAQGLGKLAKELQSQDGLQQATAGCQAGAPEEGLGQACGLFSPCGGRVRLGLSRLRQRLLEIVAQLGHVCPLPRLAFRPGPALRAPGAAESSGGPLAGCPPKGVACLRAGRKE